MHIAIFFLFVLSFLYFAWYMYDRGYQKGFELGAEMKKSSVGWSDDGE